MYPGGMKGPTRGLSQQAAEAGGSPTLEAQGRVGAAPTTTGWASTARWPRPGKRDGEVQLGVPVKIVSPAAILQTGKQSMTPWYCCWALARASRGVDLDVILIKTLLYTGVRVAELVRIRLDDVDLDACRVRITAGKGGKDRIVPSRNPSRRRSPSNIRFLSCEPLLAALPDLPLTRIGWVIAGGESGRTAHAPSWAREVRDQCLAAGVPFFFKQWGSWAPIGEGHAGADIPMCRATKKRAGRRRPAAGPLRPRPRGPPSSPGARSSAPAPSTPTTAGTPSSPPPRRRRQPPPGGGRGRPRRPPHHPSATTALATRLAGAATYTLAARWAG
jgi:Protein of unknown function (DUF5131)/Phage integrase family